MCKKHEQTRMHKEFLKSLGVEMMSSDDSGEDRSDVEGQDDPPGFGNRSLTILLKPSRHPELTLFLYTLDALYRNHIAEGLGRRNGSKPSPRYISTDRYEELRKAKKFLPENAYDPIYLATLPLVDRDSIMPSPAYTYVICEEIKEVARRYFPTAGEQQYA